VAATTTFLTIPIPAPLQRLANFLKSVWPADRAFVALLLGSILLLMARNMGSWSMWVLALRDSESSDLRFGLIEASSLLNLTMFSVYFAGAAALFVCFFPGPSPARRLVRWVYLPIALGLAANVSLVLYMAHLDRAVPLPDGQALSWKLTSLARLLHSLGSGIWSALLGTVLILYADLRLRTASVRLPIHFAPEFSARSNDTFASGQVNRFVWMMLALPFVTHFVAFPALVFADWIHGTTHDSGIGLKPPWALSYINGQVWAAVALFVLVCAAMGASRRETLKKSLRLPSAIYLGLGILLPIVVLSTIPMFQYALARAHWAAYDSRHLGPPVFSGYFDDMPAWPFLFLILGALVEEIGWRGYLQPHLISRYGLYRGIFLVGIVWGLFHFPTDFTWRLTLAGIPTHAVNRLLNCLSLGFALSWLTIRSKSVLPGALAHGVSNILIVSMWSRATSIWIMIALWVVIDFVLFRYFPPESEVGSSPETITDNPPPRHLQQLLDTPF
jgi:membrane protease YdiL (CAAX protease family)